MAVRRASSASRKPGAPLRGAVVPIQCAEEDCDAQSLLALPGPPPYAAGGFVQKGWLAMSTPLDDEVMFLCPSCAKELITGAEKELGIPIVGGRRKVSG